MAALEPARIAKFLAVPDRRHMALIRIAALPLIPAAPQCFQKSRETESFK